MKPRSFSAARRSILSSSIVFTCVSSFAFAQSTWVGDTSTDWNDAANWSNGLPGGNAFINSTTANIATISANLTVTPVDIFVGSAGTGTLRHTAGTAGTGDNNWMFVGMPGVTENFFTPFSARFVKITLTGAQRGKQWSVYELDLFPANPAR